MPDTILHAEYMWSCGLKGRSRTHFHRLQLANGRRELRHRGSHLLGLQAQEGTELRMILFLNPSSLPPSHICYCISSAQKKEKIFHLDNELNLGFLNPKLAGKALASSFHQSIVFLSLDRCLMMSAFINSSSLHINSIIVNAFHVEKKAIESQYPQYITVSPISARQRVPMPLFLLTTEEMKF